jgi:hypothetical protein
MEDDVEGLPPTDVDKIIAIATAVMMAINAEAIVSFEIAFEVRL